MSCPDQLVNNQQYGASRYEGASAFSENEDDLHIPVILSDDIMHRPTPTPDLDALVDLSWTRRTEDRPDLSNRND